MAVAITKPVPSADRTEGNKKHRVRILTFSGNYATGGEAITPQQVGLRRIEMVNFSGVARAADGATANPVAWDFTNNKLWFYEGAASGAAIGEKTDAEAHATGAFVRAEFIGH